MVKIMENPIKMDNSGVPLFLETPKSCFCVLLLGKSYWQPEIRALIRYMYSRFLEQLWRNLPDLMWGKDKQQDKPLQKA